METIDINQALPQIIKLLEIASTGPGIIITKNNQTLVKLVPVQTSKKRDPLFGSDKTKGKL
ncbi:MAG TPA: hypothetical protein V6C58_13230 [Allocoleopsis sp.]